MQYPTYDPASNNAPLDDAELAALESTLQQLPADGAMTLDGVDGFLTALLVGPAPLAGIASADWVPLVWGGDAAAGDGRDPAWPFASNQKKKRTVVLLLRHLRSIQAQLEADAANWEPVFSVAESKQGDEFADAGDWCLGFLAATDLAPDAWAPLFDDADIGPGLATIALLAGEPADDGSDDEAEPEDLDDPQVRDHLSRAAAEVVPLLFARRPARA